MAPETPGRHPCDSGGDPPPGNAQRRVSRLDFQFGDWLRSGFAAGNVAPWDSRNPDLTIVLAMALQASQPMFGPPASELFGPVPWADTRQALLDTIPDLLSYLEGDERNVVLTFVRIWATLATGTFRSKDGAADWALPRLPPEHRPVLERARWLYVSGIAAEDWGDLLPCVRPFVEHVIGEIEGARRPAPPSDTRLQAQHPGLGRAARASECHGETPTGRDPS